MYIAIATMFLCQGLNWLKGHAKLVWGIELSPFYYWLTLGLITSYLGLWSWWRLCKELDNNIWLASCITYGISLIVTILLNSISYGFNPRASIAIVLIVVAGLIVK